MALIALERSRRLDLVPAKDLERRLDLGYAMLFDRMRPGGGWNAGNSVVYNVALARISMLRQLLCRLFASVPGIRKWSGHCPGL